MDIKIRSALVGALCLLLSLPGWASPLSDGSGWVKSKDAFRAGERYMCSLIFASAHGNSADGGRTVISGSILWLTNMVGLKIGYANDDGNFKKYNKPSIGYLSGFKGNNAKTILTSVNGDNGHGIFLWGLDDEMTLEIIGELLAGGTIKIGYTKVGEVTDQFALLNPRVIDSTFTNGELRQVFDDKEIRSFRNCVGSLVRERISGVD